MSAKPHVATHSSVEVTEIRWGDILIAKLTEDLRNRTPGAYATTRGLLSYFENQANYAGHFTEDTVTIHARLTTDETQPVALVLDRRDAKALMTLLADFFWITDKFARPPRQRDGDE